MVPKSLTQSWFASYLSHTFLPDQQVRVGSLLQTEQFLPGTSLLLNAQRKKLHEGRFDRYLRVSICSRIVKWSSQTHTDLLSSSRFITKTLWIETLMNTSTSKQSHLENKYTNLLICLHSGNFSISSRYVLRDVNAQEWIHRIIRKQSTAHASVLIFEQILAFSRYCTE